MPDNDDRTLTEKKVLAEFARDVLAGMEEIMNSFDASLDASQDRMERHFAAIRNEAELSRRLADMKLPLDQEQLLYSVLTLPPEALGMLREHLGTVLPRQEIK
jgi:hypothetical protein